MIDMITLIATLEMSDGMGDKNGNLLFNIPRNNARFKRETKGKKLVIGRKTWETFPKKLLRGKEKYVLTKNKDFKANGAKTIHSIDEVLELAKDNDIVIIGGGETFEQLIPHADKLVITHVHEFDFRARVFFPDFTYKEWKLEEMERFEETDKLPSFTFATYTRKTNN